MQYRSRITLVFAAALLAITAFAFGPSAPAYAQGGSTWLVAVHGIPGDALDPDLDRALPVDVKLTSPALPEDVCVPDFTFSQVLGPVELPAGTYGVAISLASDRPDGNCSGTPILSAAGVSLMAGESYSAVAYLTEDGDPTLGLYNNGKPMPGQAQVAAYHVAAAPAVDISILRNGKPKAGGAIIVSDVVNGDQVATGIRPGNWSVEIAAAGGGPTLFGPAKVQLKPSVAYLFYAIGSFEGGSFQVVGTSFELPKSTMAAGAGAITPPAFLVSIGAALHTAAQMLPNTYLPAVIG
jgi:hypothetical protein